MATVGNIVNLSNPSESERRIGKTLILAGVVVWLVFIALRMTSSSK